MSVLLQNACLVQWDPPTVQVGDLRIAGSSIAEIGPSLEPQPSDDRLDCNGRVVLPGLVNGHTHLYSALATGMPAPPRTPRNFHEILQLIWWRLDRAHDSASVKTSGQIGALAALRCGTTTLIDHHASPHFIDGSLDALAEGLATVGCRGVLCYETTDRNRAGESAEGLVENERFVEACRATDTRQFAGMIGAHASFTMSEESLAAAAELAQRLAVGVHIHVAEDPVDERLTRAQFGCGLWERFQRHRLLELEGNLFAHGTHLSREDIDDVNRRTTISIAHNPQSNMNNGVGYTKVSEFLRPPLLGTDGIGADMWREARTALFKSHDAGSSIGYARPLEMLAASARFASRCLGVQLGVLQEGAAADIVVTDYRPPTPLTADNLSEHLIFALGPEYVHDVMIGGAWHLRAGRVVSCDEDVLRQKAVGVSRELHRRMAQIEV